MSKKIIFILFKCSYFKQNYNYFIKKSSICNHFYCLEILGVEDLPNPSTYNGSIKGYEWKLDTKYYSANITLYSVQETTAFDDYFCENIQATIFYFNGSEVYFPVLFFLMH